MISLSLHNYRKFSDIEVEFPDGITGIIGLNGVGKSSLVEAIAWVLYGHDATRTKKEGIKRSQAPRDKDCSVVLKIEMNGDFYEVSRVLRGTNLATDAWIKVNGKEWVRSSDKTTRDVEKLLGMDRRSFFRSFYAKQKELSVLSGITPKDRKDVIIKMLRIDALDKAVEKVKIDKKEKVLILDALKSQIPDKRAMHTELEETKKKLGEILRKRDVRAKILNELSSSFQIVKKELQKLEDLRESDSDLRNKLIELETELRNANSTVKELKKAIDSLTEDEKEFLKLRPMVEDLDKLRSEEIRLSGQSKKFLQRQNLIVQIERDEIKKKKIESKLSEMHPETTELEEMVETLRDGEELLDRIRNGIQKLAAQKSAYQREVEMLKEKVDELENKKVEITELGKDARCPTCGRELGDDYTLIIEHFEKDKLEIIRKIASKEDEIEKLEQRLRRGEEMKISKVKRVRSLRDKRIGYEKKREEATQLTIQKGELEGTLTESRDLLEGLGEVSYNEDYHSTLKQKIDEKLQIQEKLTAYRTKLDSRSELKKKREETEAKIENLSREVKEIKAELKSLNYSKDTHSKTKSRFENISAELDKERENLHEVEIELRSTEDRLESLKSSVDEISRREKEVNKLEGTVVKLAKLVEIFGDFRLQLIQKIRPRLTHLASTLFERMTEGRYQGVELSEDYELSLIEEGSAYTIDRFSGGETDLANLSLRLAISELIIETTGNELSFIILDEIFGSQDVIRKGLIMNALKELSRRFRQILLITHVEEIKDSLENIIEVYENVDGVSAVRQE